MKQSLLTTPLLIALFLISAFSISIVARPANATIGQGYPDIAASASTAQSLYTGTITSESGAYHESTITDSGNAASAYTLVLSSNTYSFTSLGGCSCTLAWEQFVFENIALNLNVQVEQWLLSYRQGGYSCPSGFSNSGTYDCLARTAQGVSSLSFLNLQSTTVTGSASSSQDYTKYCPQGSNCTTLYATDHLQLYNHWTKADFNVYGDPLVTGYYPTAAFTMWTSLSIKISSGTTLSCATIGGGFINEGNDFTYGACTPGSNSISFSEDTNLAIHLMGYTYCTSTTSCTLSTSSNLAGTSCCSFPIGATVVVAVQVPHGTITVSDLVISLLTSNNFNLIWVQQGSTATS